MQQGQARWGFQSLGRFSVLLGRPAFFGLFQPFSLFWKILSSYSSMYCSVSQLYLNWLKRVQIKKIRAFCITYWRILFWLSYTTFLIWPLFIGYKAKTQKYFRPFFDANENFKIGFRDLLTFNMPWKIGQCIMVRTDERWVLCYICMCKSIEGQSQIKIPSINLIRDQFSMNWASRNDYQASHIFFFFLFCKEKDCNKFFFVQ